MSRKRKRIQFGSSLERLEEKELLSISLPTAYTDPAPNPAPVQLPPAYVYPYPITPPANTTPPSPLMPPPAQQDPTLPPLQPYNPPIEPYLPATIVIPVAYVEAPPPPSRIDLTSPAWPTAPAQPPVYGPYDPNDPLQKGVTVPPAQPYYGPVLPQPGPTIYDAKPGPMPPPPSLIPPQLPS